MKSLTLVLRHAVALGLVLGVMCFAVPATAQSGHSQARSSSSPDDAGLTLGPLVARPGIEINGLFDSNVYRDAIAPEADFGLEVVPYFGLLFPGDDFRWSLDAYYRFFTYFNLAGRNHNVFRRVTHFGIGTAFDIGRRSKVGFTLAPDFYNNPSPRGFGDGTEQIMGVNVPLQLRFRPTQAFNITVDGRWNWARSYFSAVLITPDPTVLGNRHEIAGGFGLDWRFFPRSHLLFKGEVGRVLWGPYDPNPGGSDFGASQENSTFWRVYLGLKGDITRKLSFLALIGYGNAYFGQSATTPNLTGPTGLLGKVEFAVRPVLTQRLALGFSRDFQFTYYSNRVEATQAYFKYQGLFFQRLTATFDFSWNFRNLVGHITRNEHQWTAGVGLEILITEWLHAGVSYRFSAVNPSSTNEGEYIDNLVKFGVTIGFK